MRLILTSIFLSSVLHASTFDVIQIQENFYNKVVLEPLYLKRYKKYLNNACNGYNEKCYSLELPKLMNMITVTEDASLQKLLKRRDNKFVLDDFYWNKVQTHLWDKRKSFSYSQFIALIDLSKQILILVLWDNEKKTFYPIGFDFISSGNINKEVKVAKGEDHYLKTPAGLFSIQSGWRSKGETLEDNVTLPYGKKNRFVFYFGKQKSIRYNTFYENGKKIKNPKKWQLITDELNLAAHAHKSATSLGEPNSHGCIRMSDELNLFLDNNLVFFKHLYNKTKKWTHPYLRPPNNPQNHNLAGSYLLIIDK